MVNELVKRGALRQHLEAKVFGGASLLHAGNGVIGSRNGEFALEYLRAEEIRVVASDLGGDAPRKIYFSRERSTVGVRYLRRAGEDVARRERDYGSRLRAPAACGELELFG